MTRRDQVATAIIVVGIILIAVGGSKESTCYTLAEVMVSSKEGRYMRVKCVRFMFAFLSAELVFAAAVYRLHSWRPCDLFLCLRLLRLCKSYQALRWALVAKLPPHPKTSHVRIPDAFRLARCSGVCAVTIC